MDNLASKTEIADGSKEGEDSGNLSQRLRHIIKSAGLDKLANVLTEEEVVSEERRKIQEILGDQFAQIQTNEDNGVKRNHDSVKVGNMMDLMSDEIISQTFDEIKSYQKQIERTKEKAKKLKNDFNNKNEDSSNRDEL